MCVLCFDVLARTGEMLSLTAGQMHLGACQAVIAFTHTKRGQRIGVDESVVVRDATVLKVSRNLARGRLPGDRVLDMTARELRKMLAAATAILGLREFACRPYSLRRGVRPPSSEKLDRSTRWLSEEDGRRLPQRGAISMMGWQRSRGYCSPTSRRGTFWPSLQSSNATSMMCL